MASTPIRLATGQLANTSAALYTSTNLKTQIIAATLANPTAGALTYSFWIVPSADTAADDTIIYDAVSIAAGETVALSDLIGHMLNAGDSIHGAASSATSLTYHLSGTQIT